MAERSVARNKKALAAAPKARGPCVAFASVALASDRQNARAVSYVRSILNGKRSAAAERSTQCKRSYVAAAGRRVTACAAAAT